MGLFAEPVPMSTPQDEVAFFGPCAVKDDSSPVTAEDFRTDVLDYLKRRFDTITELGTDGYVTVWSRPG